MDDDKKQFLSIPPRYKFQPGRMSQVLQILCTLKWAISSKKIVMWQHLRCMFFGTSGGIDMHEVSLGHLRPDHRIMGICVEHYDGVRQHISRICIFEQVAIISTIPAYVVLLSESNLWLIKQYSAEMNLTKLFKRNVTHALSVKPRQIMLRVTGSWTLTYESDIPFCKFFHDAVDFLSFSGKAEAIEKHAKSVVKLHPNKLHTVDIGVHYSKLELLVLPKIISNLLLHTETYSLSRINWSSHKTCARN